MCVFGGEGFFQDSGPLEIKLRTPALENVMEPVLLMDFTQQNIELSRLP